jgi:uncharacterized membrane protein
VIQRIRELFNDNNKKVFNYLIIRQAMYYDVTPMRVRATIVAVEKQQVFHNPLVCTGMHAMRQSHIVICGLPRSANFFHIIP